MGHEWRKMYLSFFISSMMSSVLPTVISTFCLSLSDSFHCCSLSFVFPFFHFLMQSMTFLYLSCYLRLLQSSFLLYFFSPLSLICLFRLSAYSVNSFCDVQLLLRLYCGFIHYKTNWVWSYDCIRWNPASGLMLNSHEREKEIECRLFCWVICNEKLILIDVYTCAWCRSGQR
jgi:hypothetical protein